MPESPQERAERFASLICSGKTITDVAKEVGTSRQNVCQVIKKYLGLSVKKIRKPMHGRRPGFWTKEKDKLLGTDTDKIIGKLLGTCTAAVSNRRRKLGIFAYGNIPSVVEGSRLTLVRLSDILTKGEHRHWVVRCECGKEFTILSSNLMRQLSCGCLRKKMFQNGGSCNWDKKKGRPKLRS